MRNTWTIAWKEIRAYFLSPTAYIVGLMFLALTGYFFVRSIDVSSTGGAFPEASIRRFLPDISFYIMPWLAPILTMRLLAEEQKVGTIELLLTAPVRDWEVVLGKFLASFTFFLATVALTLWYVILLFWFGDPDAGPLFSGYLGLVLYGAVGLSVGLLASSLTSNQIVAAVVSLGILGLLTYIDRAADQVSGLPSTLLGQIGLVPRFDDFVRGVIGTNHIVYFVSLTLAFLFLTIRSVETRRWR